MTVHWILEITLFFILLERQCKIQHLIETRMLTIEQTRMLSSFSHQYVIPKIATLSKRCGLIFCSQATFSPATTIEKTICEAGFEARIWCFHPHVAEVKLKEYVSESIDAVADNCALLFIFCLLPSISAELKNTELFEKLIPHIASDVPQKLQGPLV